ncbi:hypothetical protein ACN20G_31325 (plasmid) [Streptomyces sp. BI20]|uniref:hypothetical protein n=1 Tax=Streptomyces sp. BI20 TaxID=3403460 RepID=UPI003C73BEFF
MPRTTGAARTTRAPRAHRRALALAALTLALGLGAAPAALAETPSPGPSGDGANAAPTEAGTSFRTATAFRPGTKAGAEASTGDYLYWVTPLDSGDRATVRAEVTLPPSPNRSGPATWRVDVYDGLRRRQPCTTGAQSATAAREDTKVTLACTLRTVRPGAEQWDEDPLPGSYYIRLTVANSPRADLGLPVKAAVEVDVRGTGGAWASDGALAAPLVAGGTDHLAEDSARIPEDGWASGRWSARWIWTAAGGAIAALTGILGYRLTRGRGRPPGVPGGA